MYETRDGETGHVLAVHDTITEALADAERISETIEAQLAANGEGHRNLFWVHLPIYDTETGQRVAGSSYGLLPTLARPAS